MVFHFQHPLNQFGQAATQNCHQLPSENLDWCKTILLAKISNKAMANVPSEEVTNVVKHLVTAVEMSKHFRIGSGYVFI